VSKPYGELTDDEKAPDHEVSGCTVCLEDQEHVRVGELPEVVVCRFYAAGMKRALERIVADDRFRVESLTGYRVGQTRGRVVDGRRTQFSNHSYGTAIDVNAASNGLYRNCELGGKIPRKARDIRGCKRGIGGRWDPRKRPRTTVVYEGPVHRAFAEELGWKWGGEISGRLKDFMHFSPDGF